MTETSLAKKYQKWEHMDVDDEVPEKKEDPVAAARRQLEQDVQLPPEELVRHSPEKAPKEERSEPHEEDAASTKSSRATLVEQMDEMDLGVSGLDHPANNYTKALEVFMKRDGETFLARWNQMAPQMRMNVIDVTFDAMLNHTVQNTTAFRLNREDYFLLCPEIAPESRKQMARDADEFPKLVRRMIKTTKAIAVERLRRRRHELQDITLEIGRSLQYQIVIGEEEAEGSLELFSSVYRLLVSETLVCTFEALIVFFAGGRRPGNLPQTVFEMTSSDIFCADSLWTGRKAADMDHMKADADDDEEPKPQPPAQKNIEDELD